MSAFTRKFERVRDAGEGLVVAMMRADEGAECAACGAFPARNPATVRSHATGRSYAYNYCRDCSALGDAVLVDRVDFALRGELAA